MYSTNGRVKNSNKETASTPEKRLMVCPDCNLKQEVARIFGEEAECSRCFQTLQTILGEE